MGSIMKRVAEFRAALLRMVLITPSSTREREVSYRNRAYVGAPELAQLSTAVEIAAAVASVDRRAETNKLRGVSDSLMLSVLSVNLRQMRLAGLLRKCEQGW